jgi:hypothetical protein
MRQQTLLGEQTPPRAETHHHRYSRSVPAPLLLGDIKSIWSEGGQNVIGSPRKGGMDVLLGRAQAAGRSCETRCFVLHSVDKGDLQRCARSWSTHAGYVMAADIPSCLGVHGWVIDTYELCGRHLRSCSKLVRVHHHSSDMGCETLGKSRSVIVDALTAATIEKFGSILSSCTTFVIEVSGATFVEDIDTR